MPDGSDLTPTALADHAAERAVLAACFIDAEATLPAVRGILTAEDFHRPGHALVWQAVLAAADAGGVDVVTVAAELRRMQRLNSVGGPQFLGELTDEIPTTVHAALHARLVKDAAVRRRLVAALSEAHHDVIAAASAEEALSRVNARVAAAGEGAAEEEDDSLVTTAEELFVDLERAGEGQASGVSTGMPDVDAVLGGYFGGDLVLLGADNGRGKTAWALQGVRSVAEAGCEALVFSYEMPKKRVLHRLAQHVSGVGEMEVRAGRITAQQMTDHGRAIGAASALPVKVLVKGFTVEMIVAKVRAAYARAKARGSRLGLVVVDYLQIIPPTPRVDDPRNVEARIARITRTLKQLAMDCDVPVIVLAQFNRDGNKASEPTMHDFKYSGAAESDADVVVLLHAANADSPERVAIVPKNRGGEPGARVALRWAGRFQWFHSPAAEAAAESAHRPHYADLDDDGAEAFT